MTYSIDTSMSQLYDLQLTLNQGMSDLNSMTFALSTIQNVTDTFKNKSELTEIDYQLLQVVGLTDTIFPGVENLSIYNKEEIVFGCENILKDGYNRLKSFFKWLWNKVVEFFKKAKDFILGIFSSKDKSIRRIKRQLTTLDKLAAKDSKIKNDLKTIVNSIIHIPLEHVPTNELKKLFRCNLDIVEAVCKKLESMSEEEGMELGKDPLAGHEYVEHFVLKHRTETTIDTVIWTIFEKGVPKYEKTTIGNIVEHNESIVEFYMNLNEKLKKLLLESDQFTAMIEKELKYATSVLVAPGHNDIAIQYTAWNYIMVTITRMMTSVNVFINKSFLNEIAASNLALSTFEKGVRQHVDVLIDKDFEVLGTESPLVINKVHTYENMPVYTSVLFKDSNEFNALMVGSPLTARNYILVSNTFLKLQDDEIKNWALAHELGHSSFQHTTKQTVELLGGPTLQFKSIEDVIETVQLRHAVQTHKMEYEADAAAYRKYGYDITMKALKFLRNISDDEDEFHPSATKRIAFIEKLHENEQKD